MRILKYITLVVIAITVALYSLYVVLDQIPRYLSWKSLSHDELKEKALKYSRGLPVCLYVVDCSTDVARLKLIRDEADLDVDKLKEVFWKRRFESYCKGRTEDIVIYIPDDFQPEWRIYDARWSFYHDRFITNNGNFQGSFVSFYPYEKCTANDVLWK